MLQYEKDIHEMESALGDRVRKAYEVANDIHKNQKRKSGEPYITHPVAVAKLLFEIGADSEVVCAALLHDTIEDAAEAAAQEERILREFGDHVLYIVHALSKDQNISDKIAQQDAYIQQIQRAFEIDISVFFIKVADILHNMSTIMALSPQQKEQWVKELKYQYLPLFSEYFHRLPMPYHEMYHKLMVRVQDLIETNK